MMEERVTKQMKRIDNTVPWGAQPAKVVTTDVGSDATFAAHVAMCESSDPQEVSAGVLYIRQQMSLESNPPTHLVLSSGVVPTLVKWMRNYEYPEIQLEASWAMSNIASGSSEDANAVVYSNAVEVWVEHLGSPVYELVDQALWGIGNVVGDGQRCRDFCLQAGALQGIFQVLTGPLVQQHVAISRNGVWAMANFCRVKHLPQEFVGPIVQGAVHFVMSPDAETSLDAMWALSYLSEEEDHSDGPRHILRGDALPAVMTSIDSILQGNDMCRVPLLRTLGSLSSGSFATLAVAKVPGVLQFLQAAIVNPDNFFSDKDRREAMWAVSNLAADSGKDGEKCIHVLVEGGFAPLIVAALAEFTTNYPLAKEALFTATNIFAGGTEDQKMLLVQMGVLQLIVQWLKHSNAGDFQILCNCLEGIENILQCEFGPSCANLLAEHGFLEVLQDLSNSHNQSVARMATQIGNTYFSESN